MPNVEGITIFAGAKNLEVPRDEREVRNLAHPGTEVSEEVAALIPVVPPPVCAIREFAAATMATAEANSFLVLTVIG